MLLERISPFFFWLKTAQNYETRMISTKLKTSLLNLHRYY